MQEPPCRIARNELEPGVSMHLSGKRGSKQRLRQSLTELAAGDFADAHPNRIMSKTRLAQLFFRRRF